MKVVNALVALLVGLPFAGIAHHGEYEEYPFDPNDDSPTRDWDFRRIVRNFEAGPGDARVALYEDGFTTNSGGVHFKLDSLERGFRLFVQNNVVVPNMGPYKVGFYWAVTDADAKVLMEGPGCGRIWPTGDEMLALPPEATDVVVYFDEVTGIVAHCKPFDPAPGTAIKGTITYEAVVDRTCTQVEHDSFPSGSSPCVWIYDDSVAGDLRRA